MICEKCNTSYDGNFCPNCGHSHIIVGEHNAIPTRKKGNVCSILGIIFGAIGIIPLLNVLFLIPAIILTVIGVIISKNRKRGATIASVIVVVISLVVSILWMAPAFDSNNDTNSGSQNSSSTNQEETLDYKTVYEGGTITTDFVTITIDEVSTTTKLYLTDSYSLTPDAGEIVVYVKGTITNTSSSSYSLNAFGSNAYSVSSPKIDAELLYDDGTKGYGSLFVDEGDFYGMLGNGYLSAGETVDYYIAFIEDEIDYYSDDTELTIAFVKNFADEPAYDRKNCDFLYKLHW